MDVNQKTWTVTSRQRFDLEMLLSGGFSPLTGFLGQADYQSVLLDSRLQNGALWPMPITLDVSASFANTIAIDETIILLDFDQTALARLQITDIWQADKILEAEQLFGTIDTMHPGVDYLFNRAGRWYLGGILETIQLPTHADFATLRMTPQILKNHFKTLGWKNIVGFQTRNPIHRAHWALTLEAIEHLEGNLLLHPVVGVTRPGDIDYPLRVRCYQKILPYYPKDRVLLSLLPLAMRMAGPREALWHALIRKNYGCTHFIVGRDHAGPGLNSQKTPFYTPYAAQEWLDNFKGELGIDIIPVQEMAYVAERKRYAFINDIKPEETIMTISGTALREKLMNHQTIPAWFSFPEIIKELTFSYTPRHKQGLTLFFTGLSGSGKSTLAYALQAQLNKVDERSVSILDGDLVRELLGNKLGFSKEDRYLNIRLISFIAAEITKAGGIAICALIAPYRDARKESRTLISQHGGFIELYNSTPLSVCQDRDPKGLYNKARLGQLKKMTGIDDIYEPPESADIILDTTDLSINESVQKIVTFLYNMDYLKQMEKIDEKLPSI
ncbi:MAG: bifunctional sulfate adenylyltransferase/adenylylsulfate kinase [Legionellaceae bacterium]|nr:bifunctional sulfate adenylyltransferase/adenylylsulfate kinase [Legionellaceae bacterium]